MRSMSESGALLAQLENVQDALGRIARRFKGIEQAEDFIRANDGLDRLDGICMMLIAVGETVKNIDKLTGGTLLKDFPAVDWKAVKGVRDVMAHHYFDVDIEQVFSICAKDIPALAESIAGMIEKLKGRDTENT
jgi:uncharacterized protein with HEPN domain